MYRAIRHALQPDAKRRTCFQRSRSRLGSCLSRQTLPGHNITRAILPGLHHQVCFVEWSHLILNVNPESWPMAPLGKYLYPAHITSTSPSMCLHLQQPSKSKGTSNIHISYVLHRSTIIYNTTYLTCLHPIRPHHCQHHHHSPEHPFSQPNFSLFRTCTTHQHPKEVCGFPVKGHIFQGGAVMYLKAIRPKR